MLGVKLKFNLMHNLINVTYFVERGESHIPLLSAYPFLICALVVDGPV